MRRQIKRKVTVLALALSLLVVASPAHAFEPPADPAGNFDCEGSPVAGFPGHGGQAQALSTGNTVGAWNAVSNSSTIDLCP